MIPRIRLAAPLLVGALLFTAGCAGSGRPPADATLPAAAFVAPDGARATPNTGASRLADGLGSGLDVPAPGAAPAAGAAAGAGASASADGVTFTWKGGGTSVNLAGDFNAWSASADPMAKQADGSFRLVKTLAPGRYAYKFVVDGQWQPDPAASETVEDGFGGKNSLVVVGAGAAGGGAGAAAAGATVAGAGGIGAAASGDGAVFAYTGPGAAVNVAGDWNNWDMNADAMTKQPDGSFRLVKNLPPGRYSYKFVVDGQWTADPAAKETVDDGFGGKNAVIVVGSAAAPGGASAAPAAGAPVAGAAGAAAAAGAGRAPEVTAGGVRFTFGGAAKTVHLAGDFNGWSTTTDPLTRGADGSWTIVKALPAGTHAYKFVVDGTTWKPDDANPASADDGFGGKNSLVTVP